MGNACVSREDKEGREGKEGRGTCWERQDKTKSVCFEQDVDHMDERETELQAAVERDRILDLTLVDEDNATFESVKGRMERYYSVAEFDDVSSFRSQFIFRTSTEDDFSADTIQTGRKHTLVGQGFGPWGIAAQRGGTDNAYLDVDGTKYKVRGGSYLSDRTKVLSLGVIAELVVFDLFMNAEDLPHISASEKANTIQRLRRDGEKRKLLVLNLRLVPLHAVAVWALPSQYGCSPAEALFSRFINSMDDEERRKRLKVVPKLMEGPWIARKAVGEGQPAILGRNIPLDFHSSENELEVSVGCGNSSVARRVVRVLQPAAKRLDIELALVIEGLSAEELPERVCCGFRAAFPDLGCLRTLRTPPPSPPSARPAFLPSEDGVADY